MINIISYLYKIYLISFRYFKAYISTERLHSTLDYLTPDKAYYEGTNDKCFDAKRVLLEVA